MATLGFVLRSPTPTPCTQCPGTQTYNVKFTTLWTEQAYPREYPGDAHWSGLVGESHDSRYIMWNPSGKAARGIEIMAETGKQSILLSEMAAQGNNVLATIALSGIGSGTGNRSTNLRLDCDHSQVSLVSMIAPSPDWFVGIHSVDMCNTATFEWRDGDTIDLFPYNAGTDDGLKFDSSNDDTNPKGDITRLTGSMPNNAQSSFYGYQQLQRIAQMKLTKGA
ncbi:spondin-2-like [Corticium candelabrum]|uniref:spondin-2-like n=1 Tax=Corticium candelabrum TaxID=121492 RepID=UPI002E273007|nr:spondin-2-like [Corticium candelabrum]